MKQIKNIIFDLGGVLIDWNPEYMYQKIITDEKERKYFFRLRKILPRFNQLQEYKTN